MQFIGAVTIKSDVVGLPDQHAIIILIDHIAQFLHNNVHFRPVNLVFEHFLVIGNDRLLTFRLHILARHAVKIILAHPLGNRRISFILKDRTDRIQSEAVYTHIQPESGCVEHGFFHRGVVPVQIRLFLEKVMIIIS